MSEQPVERVVFMEETSSANAVKIVVAGEMDAALLDVLEDFVARKKKLLAPETPEAQSTPKEKT